MSVHDLLASRTDAKVARKKPRNYSVLLLNDDYTPAEFVVGLLMKVFGLSVEDAIAVMMTTHRNGRGCCGVFTRDVAETKAELMQSIAQEADFPLRADIEPVEA